MDAGWVALIIFGAGLIIGVIVWLIDTRIKSVVRDAMDKFREEQLNELRSENRELREQVRRSK